MRLLTILILLIPCALPAQVIVGNVGRGKNSGVVITPKAPKFRGGAVVGRNTFISETKSLEMPLDKAVEILSSTNVISGADFGEESSIPAQAAALASIIYYPNKTSASVKTRELFSSAKYIEGKIYALMAAKFVLDAGTYAKMLASIDKNAEINVLYSTNLRKVTAAEMLAAYERKTSAFLPSKSAMNPETNVVVGTDNIYYDVPPPRKPTVIIIPKAN